MRLKVVKDTFKKLLEVADRKMYSQFGFHPREATFDKVVDYMFVPKDSSSLAVTRMLFGVCMLFDITDERGGASMEARWGDPSTCRFPLMSALRALPMPYMALVYAGLWIGALGIMLGYKYRVTAPLFTVCYWYLFLIEKSYWNNHSYLFGLVAFLLTLTDAHCFWSLDSYLNPSKQKAEVPYWNYFILKYQFFILYFVAGLKKGTAEWLTGYSMQNLSEHWVFEPFRLFLTVSQTDYLIVHWFAFVFDLTVAVWMMYSSTRNWAMVFCALFHLMNSRLFSIGMFPWVCLATMPLFYPFDWPKTLLQYIKNWRQKVTEEYCQSLGKLSNECKCKWFGKIYVIEKIEDKEEPIDETDDTNHKSGESNEDQSTENIQEKETPSAEELIEELEPELSEEHDYQCKNKSSQEKKKRITVILIIFYVLLQLFLPFSHFITKGYNNWTDGLYGYSWDMMVHTWETHAVLVKVVDNERQTAFYIDPHAFAPNSRWTRHADMVHQYAKCLKNNIIKQSVSVQGLTQKVTSNNISIYIDVWCSMNGRFVQRLIDPKVDLLEATWNPFEATYFLMPLLDEATAWRHKLDRIRSVVHSWSNLSDVIFLADFPGYELEKYIPDDLKNVTLSVLEGTIVYEPEATTFSNGYSYRLFKGETISVDIGNFHKVKNIGTKPSFLMYTFYNTTIIDENEKINKTKLPIFTELYNRFYKMAKFCKITLKSITKIVFNSCQCS